MLVLSSQFLHYFRKGGSYTFFSIPIIPTAKGKRKRLVTSLFISMSEQVLWSYLEQKEAGLILPMKDRSKWVLTMWAFSIHLGGVAM